LSDELEKLQQQHRAKTLEIEAADAQALGVGAAEAKEEAENLIDRWIRELHDGRQDA
jgi:hypothetical protein